MVNTKSDKKANLVLSDGTLFEGKGFGFSSTVFGEIVFNLLIFK